MQLVIKVSKQVKSQLVSKLTKFKYDQRVGKRVVKELLEQLNFVVQECSKDKKYGLGVSEYGIMIRVRKKSTIKIKCDHL